MPKYTVVTTRDITESTVIEVEADSPAAAEELALATLERQDATAWHIDAWSWNDSETHMISQSITDRKILTSAVTDVLEV